MQRLPLLLAVSCLGSAVLLVGGRWLLQEQRPPLTPNLASGRLERIWRLDPDPQRRREAALLLAGRSAGDGGERDRELLDAERRLLRGQGWGRDPLAAVVLKREAQVAEALGDDALASSRWRELLQRFPEDPASADALYSLGRRQPALREQLLERFPRHPATLAAAVEQGPDGALHLARWGVRWPGAGEQLRRRCAAGQPALSNAERNQLVAGLALLGDAPAAQSCLGASPATAATRLAMARALLLDPEREEEALSLIHI